MERKRRIVFNNEQVEATEIGFRTAGEHWNEYLTDDGSVLRLKLVVTGVLRIDGKFDDAGNPVYAVQSTNVVSVSAPDELRKREP